MVSLKPEMKSDFPGWYKHNLKKHQTNTPVQSFLFYSYFCSFEIFLHWNGQLKSLD